MKQDFDLVSHADATSGTNLSCALCRATAAATAATAAATATGCGRQTFSCSISRPADGPSRAEQAACTPQPCPGSIHHTFWPPSKAHVHAPSHPKPFPTPTTVATSSGSVLGCNTSSCHFCPSAISSASWPPSIGSWAPAACSPSQQQPEAIAGHGSPIHWFSDSRAGPFQSDHALFFKRLPATATQSDEHGRRDAAPINKHAPDGCTSIILCVRLRRSLGCQLSMLRRHARSTLWQPHRLSNVSWWLWPRVLALERPCLPREWPLRRLSSGPARPQARHARRAAALALEAVVHPLGASALDRPRTLLHGPRCSGISIQVHAC